MKISVSRFLLIRKYRKVHGAEIFSRACVMSQQSLKPCKSENLIPIPRMRMICQAVWWLEALRIPLLER